MSDIAKRLRASIRFDAHNGDSFERSVCANQAVEAANYIDGFEARLDNARVLLTRFTNFAIRVKERNGHGCPDCGAKAGQEHLSPDCVYLIAMKELEI